MQPSAVGWHCTPSAPVGQSNPPAPRQLSVRWSLPELRACRPVPPHRALRPAAALPAGCGPHPAAEAAGYNLPVQPARSAHRITCPFQHPACRRLPGIGVHHRKQLFRFHAASPFACSWAILCRRNICCEKLLQLSPEEFFITIIECAALTSGTSFILRTLPQHGLRCRPECRRQGTRPRPARRPAAPRT